MAAFDYLESRDDADALIEEFGQAVSVRKYAQSGSVLEPTLTPTDRATYAVRVEFTQRQLLTGNVQEKDERWLVAAGPLAALGVTEIKPPDAIVVGGVTKPVLDVDPLHPAGTVVMFDCHIRV